MNDGGEYKSGRTFFPYFHHVCLISSRNLSVSESTSFSPCLRLRLLSTMNFYQPFMAHHPLNLPLFNTSIPKRAPLPKRVPLWANQRAQATKTAKVTKLTNDPPKRTVPHRKYGRETIAEALRRRNTSIGAARTTKLPGCNPPLPDGDNIPSSQADNVDELVKSLDSTHLYILTAHRCQMAFDTNLSPM